MARVDGRHGGERRLRRGSPLPVVAPVLAAAAVALAATAWGTAGGSARASTTTSPSSTTSTTSTTVAPATTTTTTLPATTPTTTTVPPPESPTLTAAVLDATQAGARPYTVSCAHPVLSGAAGAGTIDAALAATVANAVTSFENYVNGFSPPPPGAPAPSSLTCTWSQAWLSPTLGSVSFTASELPAGAAHPFAAVTTFSFDPATGKVYTLPDLFRPGSDWLQVITQEARSLLPAVIGTSFSPPFEAPTQAKDFAAFQFAAGGLQITFQEYQVAPYAWGTPTITIPYAALASVADPAGPLASMATLGS